MIYLGYNAFVVIQSCKAKISIIMRSTQTDSEHLATDEPV